MYHQIIGILTEDHCKTSVRIYGFLEITSIFGTFHKVIQARMFKATLRTFENSFLIISNRCDAKKANGTLELLQIFETILIAEGSACLVNHWLLFEKFTS